MPYYSYPKGGAIRTINGGTNPLTISTPSGQTTNNNRQSVSGTGAPSNGIVGGEFDGSPVSTVADNAGAFTLILPPKSDGGRTLRLYNTTQTWIVTFSGSDLKDLAAGSKLDHVGMMPPFLASGSDADPNIQLPDVAKQCDAVMPNLWDGHNTVNASGDAVNFTNLDNFLAKLSGYGLTLLDGVSPAWNKASAFLSGYVPSAANWKTCLSGYYAQVATRPILLSAPFYRVVNEVVERNTSDGANHGMFYDAAAADSAWTATGLPNKVWWLVSAAQAAAVLPASCRLMYNDYGIGVDGAKTVWGDATTPTGYLPSATSDQRYYWFIDLIQVAFAACELTGAGQPAGPGGLIQGARIDAVGVQSHYKASDAFSPDEIKWHLWELGALGLDVMLSEINITTADVTGFGLIAGSPAAKEYAARLGAYRAWVSLYYSDTHSINFWTPDTDSGSLALTLFELRQETALVGTMNAMMRAVGQSGKDYRHGAFTLFASSSLSTLAPQIRDAAGNNLAAATLLTTGKFGARSLDSALPFYLPHSRYKRRVNGKLDNFATDQRTVHLAFARIGSDAAHNGYAAYREKDAGGNVILELRFTDSAGTLGLALNGGSFTTVAVVPLSTTAGICLQVDKTAGVVRAAVSRYAGGTHTPAASVVSVTGTIPAVDRYEFGVPQANVTTVFPYHALLDDGYGPIGDADIIAASKVMIGQPKSYADIMAWNAPTTPVPTRPGGGRYAIPDHSDPNNSYLTAAFAA